MAKIKVLVGCEYSGVVGQAFQDVGCDVTTCDLLPSENQNVKHYQGDVHDIMNNGFDIGIFHPPCTYLSKASACRLYKTAGNPDPKRLLDGMKAKEFFMELFEADIPKVAVENPTPLKIFELPKPTQIIQPYMFGHNVSKRTLLWLKGLPELKPTKIIQDYKPFLPSNTGGKKRGQMARTDKELTRDPLVASKTFYGIAEAMAQQWGVGKGDK